MKIPTSVIDEFPSPLNSQSHLFFSNFCQWHACCRQSQASAADSGWPGLCSTPSINKIPGSTLISEFRSQVMMIYELTEQIRFSVIRPVLAAEEGKHHFDLQSTGFFWSGCHQRNTCMSTKTPILPRQLARTDHGVAAVTLPKTGEGRDGCGTWDKGPDFKSAAFQSRFIMHQWHAGDTIRFKQMITHLQQGNLKRQLQPRTAASAGQSGSDRGWQPPVEVVRKAGSSAN